MPPWRRWLSPGDEQGEDIVPILPGTKKSITCAIMPLRPILCSRLKIFSPSIIFFAAENVAGLRYNPGRL